MEPQELSNHQECDAGGSGADDGREKSATRKSPKVARAIPAIAEAFEDPPQLRPNECRPSAHGLGARFGPSLAEPCPNPTKADTDGQHVPLIGPLWWNLGDWWPMSASVAQHTAQIGEGSRTTSKLAGIRRDHFPRTPGGELFGNCSANLPALGVLRCAAGGLGATLCWQREGNYPEVAERLLATPAGKATPGDPCELRSCPQGGQQLS